MDSQYKPDITLKQAEEKYNKAVENFEKVKSHYKTPKLFGIIPLKKEMNMNEEDKKALADCTGALMPLTLEKALHEEVFNSTGEDGDALLYKVNSLQNQIMLYLSQFKNTDVEIVEQKDLF